jgi:RHS repeat-associated protein
VRSDVEYYYIKDHLGSIRATINETDLDYFGARYYGSAIGRWLTPDPIAHMYPEWSPYNYVLGNPLRFVDLDGRQVDEYDERRGQQQRMAPRASANSTLLDRVVNLFNYGRLSFTTASSPVEQAQIVSQTAGEIANQSEKAAVEMARDGTEMIADVTETAAVVTAAGAVATAPVPPVSASLLTASTICSGTSIAAKIANRQLGGDKYSYTDINVSIIGVLSSKIPDSPALGAGLKIVISNAQPIIRANIEQNIKNPPSGFYRR